MAHSWPKRSEPRQWSEAANTCGGTRISLLNATSEHSRTFAASSLDESGGLEVPSSNLGAPINESPACRGVFLWTELAARLGLLSPSNRRPEHSQNLIHAALDEIQPAHEAKVDLALEQADDESFELPEATEPMPWENRVVS